MFLYDYNIFENTFVIELKRCIVNYILSTYKYRVNDMGSFTISCGSPNFYPISTFELTFTTSH